MKSQAETIKELSARCNGPDQFKRFDSAFRASLSVPKAAVVKEETRLKRARAKSGHGRSPFDCRPVTPLPSVARGSRLVNYIITQIWEGSKADGRNHWEVVAGLRGREDEPPGADPKPGD